MPAHPIFPRVSRAPPAHLLPAPHRAGVHVQQLYPAADAAWRSQAHGRGADGAWAAPPLGPAGSSVLLRVESELWVPPGLDSASPAASGAVNGSASNGSGSNGTAGVLLVSLPELGVNGTAAVVLGGGGGRQRFVTVEVGGDVGSVLGSARAFGRLLQHLCNRRRSIDTAAAACDCLTSSATPPPLHCTHVMPHLPSLTS